MKRILIIGAGRSSSSLIKYLHQHAAGFDWEIVVGDLDPETTGQRIGHTAKLIRFDILQEEASSQAIAQADLVISMLPAKFHILVAKLCLKHGKNLLTPSYVKSEMKALEPEIKEKGLFFLNEMGLDPGIDHMSAMKEIDAIKAAGLELLGFESFTGGLVAPESDDNPWHYKLSWNPRNVVLAGQEGIVKFRQEGKYKYIPYNRVFRRTEIIEIEGYGTFEGYANRDSLQYIDRYHLHGIPTIYRGTLRRPGFCRAWNVFVQLGMTDDSFEMEGLQEMTRRDFTNSFLYYHPSDSVETKLFHDQNIAQDSEIIPKLKWLGIFDNEPIGLERGTPAQVLEHLLKEKWLLLPTDKDMTVMWHKFTYRDNSTKRVIEKHLSLVVTGEDPINTAMAKTVGLPLGIAAKLILTGKIERSGLFIPTLPEIYEPVLTELEEHGIQFKESFKNPE
ncbi:saccharopine dehydrogenase family protein [Mangrovibacterium diazotrophicum]|uniref:Saccharopine dehydrogenase-like NADP-dependent oxidoreductase n=1 Tax=Mangrovibacterium diazotrophicum TaxID=1261403 RepID=A0A419W6G5_9BACT|nr:saccharopine dehydrogenase family protein [Mangrovibacterium diazotrophicum]RKD91045.1 saccharopine dehydrogenase-like NADP-dependent oxidoreductase [Mangrovibacterium diazotrophicum]